MTNIGENIKKFRVFRKMTQVELGEAVGRSKNVVSNWERGDNAPDLDTLEKICKILKVTPNQMFGWEPNEEYERYKTHLMAYKVRFDELTMQRMKIESEMQKLREAMANEMLDGE